MGEGKTDREKEKRGKRRGEAGKRHLFIFYPPKERKNRERNKKGEERENSSDFSFLVGPCVHDSRLTGDGQTAFEGHSAAVTAVDRGAKLKTFPSIHRLPCEASLFVSCLIETTISIPSLGLVCPCWSGS